MVAVVAALMVCTSCFPRNEQKEREADLMQSRPHNHYFCLGLHHGSLAGTALALPTLVICVRHFSQLLKMVVRHCQNKRASTSNPGRRGNPRDVWLKPGAVAELWHPGVPMLGTSDSCWVKSGCHLSPAFLILHPPCPERKPNP